MSRRATPFLCKLATLLSVARVEPRITAQLT